MTRRAFFATVGAVVAASQAVGKLVSALPPLPKLNAFIAAQQAEMRDLLQKMKHDLNRRLYADDGRPMSATEEDDYDDE